MILLKDYFKFIISYYFEYAFIYIKENSYYFLFFVWNDLEEIIGDKDGQSSQTDFDRQKRRKVNGNSHQDVDGYDDFFLTFTRNGLALTKISYICLIELGMVKPIFEALGTSGETSNRQQKERRCRQQR